MVYNVTQVQLNFHTTNSGSFNFILYNRHVYVLICGERQKGTEEKLNQWSLITK